MQNCGSTLLTVLQSTQRDLPDVDLFEFYPPTETQLTPGNAERRFAATELIWYGWKYDRQAISRRDVSRFVDGRFNTVSLTLSNVDRALANWLTVTPIEGYRVVIRMASRSVSDDSVVLFVGRCERPSEVDNSTVTINAQQDLGSIENDLPWQQFSPRCPLKFQGTECLAGQDISVKSAAYQAATVCNKSWAQCTEYANTKAFQGFRFNQTTGNFKFVTRGPLGLPRKAWKQWSSQDDTPMGKPVPLGLGRTQIDLTPVLSADTGQYLYGHWIIGEGPVAKILNLRNVTSGWATTFQFVATHNGEYGYNVDQESDSDFLGYAYYSHRAYAEATIKGENPDTGDAAPTLAAVILWPKIPVFDETCFTGVDWSDNPVEHLRYLLTEVRGLNYNGAWINNEVASATAAYCAEPLIDQTGGEDVYLSTSSGAAGTDFKRYRSTGILDTAYYRWQLGLDTTYPAERESTYNTYSTAPANPTPATWFRKRYTANWHLREAIRTTDFIFKHLLPSFRGYLITGADGRLQIRTEKPVHGGTLKANASAGATSISVEDVYTLKQQNLPIYYVLIGVGDATSETRQVTAINYSTAGNSITLAASGGGSASGATLSGGTTAIQAQARVTINSAVSTTITIDGVAITHTATATDTTGTIAAMLATRINANTTLNRYVQAIWVPTLPTQVLIRSKLGTLTLATGLTSPHNSGDIWYQIAMPFASGAFGALSRANIIKDSFKWPLSGKQSSYNQFVIQYIDAPQDFQATEIRENDYDHQEKINRVNKLEISGACVDNYHQADRLVRAARTKYRDGDFFCSFEATGLALLLEEGDVICVNHDSLPNNRNQLFRIEELRVSNDHRVRITARLYVDTIFPGEGTPRTVVLTSGIGWPSAQPGAVTGLTLTSPASGTVRGTFTFPTFVGGITAKLEILRPGSTSYVDTGIVITPNSSGAGAFEIAGISTTAVTQFRVTPISSTGQTGPFRTVAYNPQMANALLAAQVFRMSPIEAQSLGLDWLQVEVFRTDRG